RATCFDKGPTLPSEITELAVSLRVLTLGQTLAITAQGVIKIGQQSPQCFAPNFKSGSSQLFGQRSQCLVCPFGPCDRVTSGCILQQFFQDRAQGGVFFSIRWRPPPSPRWRPAGSGSDRWISARPRRIVIRLSPVIWLSRDTPPRPHSKASNPTNRRRLR